MKLLHLFRQELVQEGLVVMAPIDVI